MLISVVVPKNHEVNYLWRLFNIIYIIRTNDVAAKLRCPSLTNPATVSPQRSLLSKDETLTAYGTEFFSMNDVNRLRILQDVIDRRLTTRLAATRFEITDRHCRRLLERCREHGPLSLVNRRRGQPGNRQLMPGLAERALRIIRERYADFGPTLACEKLADLRPAWRSGPGRHHRQQASGTCSGDDKTGAGQTGQYPLTGPAVH